MVWRYGYSDDLKLWEGVVERWLGLWRIRYTERPRETLPFPPLSPLIVLCAARVFKPFSLSSRKKRHRKSRALSGKRALHDSEGPRGPAVKGKLNVATLNVTSLKLKGEDEFSLRKCGHLYEVLNFMNMKGINILGMQETRYRFSSSEKSEVLCRKVHYQNSEYFFNLSISVPCCLNFLFFYAYDTPFSYVFSFRFRKHAEKGQQNNSEQREVSRES